MRSEKRTWKIEYGIPDPPEELLKAGYNPLLANILAIKGVTTAGEARELFFNDISVIHDPMQMKGMDLAVRRIRQAIEKREKVVIYGDYDVDGITSTCLLTDYLRSYGLNVTPYIPDRNEEGYGLNCDALDRFRDLGIDLVITVDCGITACEEAAHAKALGIDMIITDHHECKAGDLPDACAVIDCKQPDDQYGNPNLAGVGVAFKLACACENDTNAILDRYGDLVAVGTVADVMALIGENRYLVICGLEKLRSDPRPGLAAMMKHSGVDPAALSASTIGFIIAPRLNAAGRLGQAMMAVDLIMSDDTPDKEKAGEIESNLHELARKGVLSVSDLEAGLRELNRDGIASCLARVLCDLNRKRQEIENEIWHDAGSIIAGSVPEGPIVLASDRWHQGVIGIAASRLADQYSMPTIMINLTDGMGKGSCRSYGGFNLFEALSACSEHLVSFGGHALAAGLNIQENKIDDFRTALSEYYRENRPDSQPELTCDLLISDMSVLSEDNVRSLDTLEPYGNGNPRPVLCMVGVQILTLQDVGNGRHLKLQINARDRIFDCIFFGHTAKEQGLREDDIADIAFTPQINEFRGKVSVQLQICGIRKHDPEDLCRNILEGGASYTKVLRQFMPERPDQIRVWKTISSGSSLGRDLDEIVSVCPDWIIPEKYCICLEVFRQAGLLSGEETVYGAAAENSVKGKKDLNATPLMEELRRI